MKVDVYRTFNKNSCCIHFWDVEVAIGLLSMNIKNGILPCTVEVKYGDNLYSVKFVFDLVSRDATLLWTTDNGTRLTNPIEVTMGKVFMRMLWNVLIKEGWRPVK